MWTYHQASGCLEDADGAIAGTGYSGHGPGVNNPALQNDPDVGPIPQGFWTISPSFSSPTKGPVVMDLMPNAATETFGRSGFMMHGDSVEHPGAEEASLGCIIMARSIRQAVAASADKELQVVP
jgi:hypothetical protein